MSIFKITTIRPKMVLVLCCTIVWTTATFAQLDKSEGYFQACYGTPGHVQQESDGSKNLFYIDDPYIIVVTFIKGQSVSIAYGKSEGKGEARQQVSLADGDIRTLLEQYREGQQWELVDMRKMKETRSRYIPGASRMWKRTDEKLIANYQSEAKFLYFAKPESLTVSK